MVGRVKKLESCRVSHTLTPGNDFPYSCAGAYPVSPRGQDCVVDKLTPLVRIFCMWICTPILTQNDMLIRMVYVKSYKIDSVPRSWDYSFYVV